MKVLLFFVIVLISRISAQDSTHTGLLMVDIIGFKNDNGKAKIALNNSEADYKDFSTAFKALTVDIDSGEVKMQFDQLVYGEYAVKVYHDQNDNDKLDTNFLGIPKEAYGFSNDARGSFGPARWEDAKFILDNDTLKITITIQ